MTVSELWTCCGNWNLNTTIKIYKTVADFIIEREIDKIEKKKDIPRDILQKHVDIFIVDEETIHVILEE